ncbi:hypothetical protein [Burkholderia sp. Ac-20365]|uniref:hypothetical protein n=1 Tax=Burkholderia sp. Ac-20365 TaxID=2703897 RepID=UPI00197C1A29|nr:hypothetical protein [Burkholderia sp. Ac-20365]MBN3763882.1 hypothetical protein [Burkholderia sp. Ac-20365]
MKQAKHHADASTKPKTQNPKPKTQNPKPKTQNPKPKTQNPKPKTQNQKPRNADVKFTAFANTERAAKKATRPEQQIPSTRR